MRTKPWYANLFIIAHDLERARHLGPKILQHVSALRRRQDLGLRHQILKASGLRPFPVVSFALFAGLPDVRIGP